MKPIATWMLSVLATLSPLARAQDAFEWNAANVEHLLNRAGFGARSAEIESAVRLGPAAYVDQLIAGWNADAEPFYVEPLARPKRRDLDESQYEKALDDYRRDERRLLFSYAGWWIDQMVDGKDPLRQKMVLFWHGYFTSSAREVKRTAPMAMQNQLFQKHALGNFRELLCAVIRDPAMIEYLDNNQNRRGNPNENLARELMELFTLGVGNYTEQDIKEGARALTGWRTNDDKTESYFAVKQHDEGKKTILGRTGRFDADDFVDILLDQPACPRWLAGKLIHFFEGRDPEPKRWAEYAAFLKEQKYELTPFLRKLLNDPRFYRGEIKAERIAGPVEYLVGCTRRLGIDVPAQLIWLGAGQLGQRLFEPPNVKGWEGDEAWITTSSLLARGNMAGMLLGVVHLEDVLKDDGFDVGDDPVMEGSMSGGTMERSGGAKKEAKADLGPELGALKRLTGEFYYPRVNLTARVARTGATTDAQIVEWLGAELLPVALSSESRAALLEFLATERGNAIADGKLLQNQAKAEDLLRRLAHLILSLPEAQLG